MNDLSLEVYWQDIPTGKENAVTYADLCELWGVCPRKARQIMHDLSLYDDGSDFVLIRSASGKGFYKTNDAKTLKAYRKEILNKGKSIFAPVKKINRVLNSVDNEQYTFTNNLRIIRQEKGLKQTQVCKEMQKHDRAFDVTMLSKMENGVCLPTPYQLSLLADIYGVQPEELVNSNLYY